MNDNEGSLRKNSSRLMPERSVFNFVSSFSENINQRPILFSENTENDLDEHPSPWFATVEIGPPKRAAHESARPDLGWSRARKRTRGSNGESVNPRP